MFNVAAGSQPESSFVIPSSLSQQLSISLLLSDKKIPSNIKRRHQSMVSTWLITWDSGCKTLSEGDSKSFVFIKLVFRKTAN